MLSSNEQGMQPLASDDTGNYVAPDRPKITMQQPAQRRIRSLYVIVALLATVITVLVLDNRGRAEQAFTKTQGPPAQSKALKRKLRNFDADIAANADKLLSEGRETFRFDTFGDEAFWGGSLQLHQAIKAPRSAAWVLALVQTRH